MKIALIGTDGLPARYGGFETFVEQIAPRFAALGHEVLVVGSAVGRTGAAPERPGLRIVNLPLRANGAMSIPFDLWSFWRVRRQVDAILLLGISAGLFVPIMRVLAGGRRIVVNVDGLESRRAKWNGLAKALLALSERVAILGAHAIVSDNAAIAAIILDRYGRDSATIAYGNDHVVRVPEVRAAGIVTGRYGLEPRTYCLTVARIEPENQILPMIEGFLRSTRPYYAIVGNFDGSDYGRAVRERVCQEPRVRLIDATYDAEALGALRACCAAYLHGHSVGGTNPSLVEILPYARPIVAFDCAFNRHTLSGACGYFRDSTDLAAMLEHAELGTLVPPPAVMASGDYTWARIAERYVAELATRGEARA